MAVFHSLYLMPGLACIVHENLHQVFVFKPLQFQYVEFILHHSVSGDFHTSHMFVMLVGHVITVV